MGLDGAVAGTPGGVGLLCEAEAEAFGRLPGAPVQCLATIARGDGITAPSLAHTHTTAAGTAAGTTATESGGISA
jgi:hypothetical protein